MAENNIDSVNVMAIIRYITIAIFIVSAYYLYGFFLESKEKARRQEANSSSSSKEMYSAIGAPFQLTDYNDQPFTSEQLKGKIALLYFGFTFCPDICPESLGKLSEVKSTLDKYNLPIQIVFITIDPKRDTASALKEYLSGTFEGIIGLTGTEAEIEKVAKDYRVYYTISAQTKDDPEDYLLDHSSFSYLLDKEGDVVKHFSFNEPAEEIVKYLVTYYKKTKITE